MRIENINKTDIIKINDTASQIRLRIFDFDNKPFDLTTAMKVIVVIGISEGRLLTKVPEVLGEVGVIEFGLDEGDLLVVGDNLIEVHIIMPNGEKHVAPSNGYYKLKVRRSIDSLGEEVTTVTLDYFLEEANQALDKMNVKVEYVNQTANDLRQDVATAIQYVDDTVDDLRQEVSDNLDTLEGYVNQTANDLQQEVATAIQHVDDTVKDLRSNEFPAQNLVINGDFRDGTTGWNIHSSYGSVAVVDGVGRIGSRYASYPAYQEASIIADHKYYFRLSAKAESSAYNIGRCGFVQEDSMSGGIVKELILGFEMENYSFIIQADDNYNRICWLRRPNSSSMEYCLINYALVIDLTKTFGTGKEPSVEEMDEILTKFPNSWFDGTVAPLISQKELYEMMNRGNKGTFEDDAGNKYRYWLSASGGNLIFNYEEV